MQIGEKYNIRAANTFKAAQINVLLHLHGIYGVLLKSQGKILASAGSDVIALPVKGADVAHLVYL